MNDLVAGQIDLIVDQLSNSINQVRAGTIRGYAVTDTKRRSPPRIFRPWTKPVCPDSI